MRALVLTVGGLLASVGCSSSGGPAVDAGAMDRGRDSAGGTDSASAPDAIGDAAAAGLDTPAGGDASPDAGPSDTATAADAGSACTAIAMLDRSCTTDGDCLVVRHVSNCCGQEDFIGIRASEAGRFASLERACDASYPLCGCAAGPPRSEDGSLLVGGAKAAVTCLRGRCTSFSSPCGHVCEGGTRCFSCSDHLTLYASCSVPCTTDGDCKQPNVPTCQDSPTGRFCTAAGIACNTK